MSAAMLEELFAAQRPRLWGLAYRLTGSGADAEDVVQESFARLLERPPAEGQPPRPWLVRVAVNLSIDALRRRRRRAYPGPWLPAPAERSDEDWLDSFASPAPDASLRYDLLESASYASLVALEALTPRERAVLLLRDALGCPALQPVHRSEDPVRGERPGEAGPASHGVARRYRFGKAHCIVSSDGVCLPSHGAR